MTSSARTWTWCVCTMHHAIYEQTLGIHMPDYHNKTQSKQWHHCVHDDLPLHFESSAHYRVYTRNRTHHPRAPHFITHAPSFVGGRPTSRALCVSTQEMHRQQTTRCNAPHRFVCARTPKSTFAISLHRAHIVL